MVNGFVAELKVIDFLPFLGLGRAGKTQNIKEKTMADWEMAEYNIEAKVKREKAESDAGKM